ncbi:hypothetical protein LTR95_015409, partial [Oleoguttula sp. CCFEE 5521]
MINILVTLLSAATIYFHAADAYFISLVDVGQSNCGATVKAKEILTVRWTLDNATEAIGDTCYVAVRSEANRQNESSYAVDG